MTTTEINIIILVILILVAQGSWIFYDASKRGESKWLWGFFGLLNAPSSLIIYLLVTRRFTSQIICPNCLYSIQKDVLFCPYCGTELTEEERVEGKIQKKKIEHKNK